MIWTKAGAPRRRLMFTGAVFLIAALTVAGQGQVAIAVLASAGAAAALLMLTGHIMLAVGSNRHRDRVWRALSVLPTPIAVTTQRGAILWQNQTFCDIVFEGRRETDMKQLGESDPRIAASLFRILSSARLETGRKPLFLETANGSPTLRIDRCEGRGGPGVSLIWTVQANIRHDPLPKGDREIVGTLSSPACILSPSGDIAYANETAMTIIDASLKPITPQETAENFVSIMDKAPFAAALIATLGIVKAENTAFQKLFPAPGAQPRTLFDLVSPEPSIAKLKAYLGGGTRAGTFELSATMKNGKQRIKLSLAPAEKDRFFVFIQEEAPEVILDAETVQSQKMAAVGQLAGGIAHDFNNLLTAIIGFSDLLLVRFRASDPAFKDLMNIKNNAVRAEKLVRQILAYSSKQTLRPTLVSLTDVIQDFYSNMGQTLGEKVKAKIQHGRDLWFVKADESQLVQVVMNLALNGRDAMPNGGELTIRTANVSERDSIPLKERGLERGEYVMCEVRDTGTGIEPSHLEKIFDPFFSTKEVGKGTGLGLSTVFGIVKQTGGTILVDSAIGTGTSFRIFLPRHMETDEDLKALSQKSEPRERSADLTGSGVVLLVEDEEAVRSFASRALTTRGYTVLEASTGVEALEVMEREGGRIDLVVSDVVMPEMDGPTLLRHLRKQKPDIKFVFMSGYAEEAFRKNLGADEQFTFLPKPFTLKKLAETVKAAAA